MESSLLNRAKCGTLDRIKQIYLVTRCKKRETLIENERMIEKLLLRFYISTNLHMQAWKILVKFCAYIYEFVYA